MSLACSFAGICLACAKILIARCYRCCCCGWDSEGKITRFTSTNKCIFHYQHQWFESDCKLCILMRTQTHILTNSTGLNEWEALRKAEQIQMSEHNTRFIRAQTVFSKRFFFFFCLSCFACAFVCALFIGRFVVKALNFFPACAHACASIDILAFYFVCFIHRIHTYSIDL